MAALISTVVAQDLPPGELTKRLDLTFSSEIPPIAPQQIEPIISNDSIVPVIEPIEIKSI